MTTIITGTKLVLTRDCYVIGIHGITGREIDEGYLPKGTQVRKVVTHEKNADGASLTTFQSLSDGLWFLQKTYEPVEGLVAWADPVAVDVDDDCGASDV